jgi:DNA topoisomerase-2
MNKYSNVLDILTEFFHERLKLYSRRKAHQIECLQEIISKLDNKIRFLSETVAGTISFKGKRKQELILELETKGFLKQTNSYEYLLGMPLWNMTQDKIQALTTELQGARQQLSSCRKITPEQIWNNDLNELMDAVRFGTSKKRKHSSDSTSSNKQSRR